MRRVIPLLVCVVLALAPATAAAKKKHKKPVLRGPLVTVTAIGNVASGFGDVSTAVANCPPGTVALGGGFSVPSSSANSLNVFSSYRSGPDSWTVAAMRVNGG